jgi:hypothetical protein
MRAPGRGGQELHLLGREERPELRGEALDEILVGIYCSPVRAAIRVVVELPQMDDP